MKKLSRDIFLRKSDSIWSWQHFCGLMRDCSRLRSPHRKSKLGLYDPKKAAARNQPEHRWREKKWNVVKVKGLQNSTTTNREENRTPAGAWWQVSPAGSSEGLSSKHQCGISARIGHVSVRKMFRVTFQNLGNLGITFSWNSEGGKSFGVQNKNKVNSVLSQIFFHMWPYFSSIQLWKPSMS